MSGFLRGWLRDEPLETCCAYANANGAFAVSRLLVLGRISDLGRAQPLPRARLAASGAAPRRGAQSHPLGDDAPEPSRPRSWRWRSTIARNSRRSPTTPGALASASATSSCSRSRPPPRSRRAGRAIGMLLDGKYGREALFRAVDHGFWIGRPVEEPGSRPLEFEFGGSLGAKLMEWPVAHTIKCLCFYHPDDPPEMKARQERELLRLHDAARTARARIVDRDHRQQERAGRRPHRRARHRAAL